MITMKTIFKNAEEVFTHYYKLINTKGLEYCNTKALFNVGFTIKNPLQNSIKNKERNWKYNYAEAEWQWYLSGDRNINKLDQLYGKVPKIWKLMADEKGNVNSNYGWQWQRKKQIDYIVNKLKQNNNTRHAAISIYDCKEHSCYTKDTPCTYAIQFYILNNKLNMSVLMRSNDLWYGFCNDQYCFSKLQQLIANKTNKKVGTYYHFAHNLHLYNNFLNNNNV